MMRWTASLFWLGAFGLLPAAEPQELELLSAPPTQAWLAQPQGKGKTTVRWLPDRDDRDLGQRFTAPSSCQLQGLVLRVGDAIESPPDAVSGQIMILQWFRLPSGGEPVLLWELQGRLPPGLAALSAFRWKLPATSLESGATYAFLTGFARESSQATLPLSTVSDIGSPFSGSAELRREAEFARQRPGLPFQTGAPGLHLTFWIEATPAPPSYARARTGPRFRLPTAFTHPLPGVVIPLPPFSLTR